MQFLKKIPTVLEAVSFVWIGCFALMVLADKTVWHVLQAVACGAALAVFCLENFRQRFRAINTVSIAVGGVAMATLWYEMALSSIVDHTGPILLFTIPVLIVWQLRTMTRFDGAVRPASFGWVVPLVIGLGIVFVMDPVRRTSASNQDPESPRHSIRSAIAAATIVSSAFFIAGYRRLTPPDVELSSPDSRVAEPPSPTENPYRSPVA